MPESTFPSVASALAIELLKIVLPELIKLLQGYEAELNPPTT